MARKLVVEIIGDSRSVERAFQRSSRSAARFEASMRGVSRGITGAFAAVGVGVGVGAAVAGIKSMVTAASDLEEQIGKTRVVFGQSSDTVVAWSKTTATAFGESQRQALNAASGFGALLAPLGLVGDAAATQSKQLTELGADLASFYNTDVQDALDAIRSGLVGEVEPLRRYGVLLSEARVKAEAMAESGKKTEAALTDQDKVLARINLILQDSTQAQGDFARSSDRLAGQTKILTAQLDDMKVEIGEQLLPEVTDLVKQFNKWYANPENKQRVNNDIGDTFHYIGTSVEYAAAAFGKLRDAADWIKNWKPSKELGPGGSVFFSDWTQFAGAHGLTGPMGGLTGGIGGGNFPGGGLTAAEPMMHLKALIERTIVGGGAAGRTAGGAQSMLDLLASINKLILPYAGATVARPGPTVTQRNTWFDAMIARQLDRVQDITGMKGQIARLREIAGLIQQRIAATKDVTRRLTLEDQLVGVYRQIRSDQDQLAQAARDAAAAARKAHQEMIEANAARLAEAEQTARDWAQLAVDRTQLTDTLSDDLKARRSQLAVIEKQIAVHGKTLELEQDKLQVQLAIKDIRRQQAEAAKADLDSVEKVTASLASPWWTAYFRALNRGATGAEAMRAGRLARAGAGATAAGGRPYIVISGGVHMHGVHDMAGLENQLAKRARARPHVRRGARE